VTAQNKPQRLIVFDVEGVLLPKKRYLLFEVGRNLRFSEFTKIIFYGFFYELGLMSLKSALQRIFRVFKGIRADELLKIFRQVPLLPGAEEVFEQLRNDGWKTALISSGLPTLVVQDLAQRLKADYAYGFELEVKDGALTGEIWGDVIEHKGKLPVLMKILETEKLSPRDCVVVADDRNNTPIFLPGMLKIGYEPDFAVRIKADVVVTGKLQEILHPIKGEPAEKTSHLSRHGIIREVIHACGFLVPVLTMFLGLYPVALLISVISLLYVISELARMERKNLPVISSITVHAATQTELYEFTTAPIFFALGILLTLLIFPFSASSPAIAIFCLGDSTASVFGRIFGRRILPFNKGKTLEGSVIGFVFAFLGGVFFIAPWKALLGAVVAITVECLPLPLNDNLVTPLVTGVALVLAA
jgi:HAD superfamily phosphoserine phosphatase-like hydrolase